MTLKRLSDVQVGQVIKISNRKYKLSSTAPYGYLVQKEVLPGIFADSQVDVSSVVTNYSGASNTLVELVEVGSAPKSDLTSQLRTQQKQQSLTDSLRQQSRANHSWADAYAEQDDDDYEDEEEDEEDEDDDYPYYGTGYGSTHVHSHISAFDAPQPVIQFNGQVPQLDAAKASALSANLKAQQAQTDARKAQQSVLNAHVKINDISKGIAGLHGDVSEELGYLHNAVSSMDYDVANARQAADDVSYELERTADVAYDAQDAAYEAINRVAAIENKQKQEEHKMNLQNELNAKLAAKKAQSDLQAQLNQKLNQKTTGGNGTMKKLFGAAFNFGKVEGKFAFSPITGGLALRKGLTNDFVAYNKDTKELTDVSGLTLKFDVPAFKLPVAGAAVEVGDLIIHNGEFVYVTKKNDGYLETLNPEKGVNGSVVPTKNALLGATFYTVVKTLDAAGQGGFNPMLLMAMNKGGDKQDLLPLLLMSGGLGGNGAAAGAIDPMMLMLMGDDTEDLLPLVLMQQGGATGAGFNPLMFLLTQKGGKGKDLLPLLMMSGGLNGQAGAQAGGMNPMMMMALAGDGDIDMTTLALMGGFGGQGLFGQAAPAVKEVKGK